MSLRVMGTTEVIGAAGDRERITGRLQRTLLATLVVNGAGWTPPHVLIEALWPDDPGPGAEGRLHVLVHRLRARIGDGVVVRGEHGYRLDPGVEVDVWTFERAMSCWLRDHGRLTRSGLALERLEQVLGLWQGLPFAQLDDQRVAAEQARLLEMQVSGQETRFQHLLDRGEHVVVLRDVVSLARQHPWRERLRVVWMTALLRAGRRADALRLYAEAERDLRAELGVEPGRELQELRRLAASGDWAGPLAAPAVTADPDSAGVDGRHAAGQRELAERWAVAGRLGEALRLLGQIEVHCRANGLRDELALLLRSMAVVNCQIGDLERGLRLVRESVDVAEQPGPAALSRVSEALILTHLRRTDDAERVLAALAPDQWTPGPAVLWWRARAQVLRRRGVQDGAVMAARRGVALARKGADPGYRALVHVDLGSALRDAGDRTCLGWFRSSVELARSAGARPAAALAHGATAKAWLRFDEPGRSAVHGREALGLARECGAWGLAGRAALRLADATELLGDPVRAAWYRTEGLSHYRRVDYPLAPRERDRVVALVAAAEESLVTS
ncbi:BTAD domain-containing putative transcriptional regulator [Nocardioides sp. L-11A]|uniref:BTAD domain-containing putative transcriptional regulator n=1 Tax=Nocardioides sp. L-11A TaxID=3043848 RepID=UPI00249B0B02|nr:BTAD domain-containing putative transcriptional regulator [Nocardioides sp. L-11A]